MVIHCLARPVLASAVLVAFCPHRLWEALAPEDCLMVLWLPMPT